ncbi:MAG: hypothetical protein JWM64_1722, partial [Frankiales bacterium]|nr:hypothetical protein [Frankiales bacterium]
AGASDPAVAARTTGVRALLARRASALEHRDRDAFLASVAPGATSFRSRQAALFDALGEVPLRDVRYVVDPDTSRPASPAVDARRGPGWWAPDVVLRYRLGDHDPRSTDEQQSLTFVRVGSGWGVAADDDFPGTARGLWDAGPVAAVVRPHVLVLGHPGHAALLIGLADQAEAAVPRVSEVWGTDWARHVVLLVPDGEQELRGLVPGDGDLEQLAAVSTAQVDPDDGTPVGDRVVVNRPVYAQLGRLGRRVVLTHEVLHVATRAETGPRAPSWLVEGLADVVGYRGTDVPLPTSARALQEAVRAGRVPTALPDDDAFDGGADRLEEAYEQAFTAVALLLERYGRERTLALYRAAGRVGAEQAFSEVLGSGLDAFTRDWQASLRERLG